MDTEHAWPQGRLPIRVDLALGADPAGDPADWKWTDVGSDRLLSHGVTITSGRADESGQAQPASATVELDNPDGTLMPDSPASPWYPHIRLGVPARISVQAGAPYLRIPAGQVHCATTPPSPSLAVSAIDLRVDMALDLIPAVWSANPPTGYTPHAPAHQEIAGVYDHRSDERSWRLLLDSLGRPRLDWSEEGVGIDRAAIATEAVPYLPGERWSLRVVLEPDDGEGGHQVHWYTARAMGGPWRPLGQPHIAPGTTRVHPADAPLEIGDILALGYPSGAGRYYGAELRDGADGRVVAAPDFAGLDPGTSEWTDSAGLAWNLTGDAEVTDWRTRLVGHVAEWAPRWPYGDLSTSDGHPGEARVDATISGVLRRLGQGAQPLRSALARHIPRMEPAPVAYWPMEDGLRALWAASGLDGHPPLALRPVEWGRDDTLPGSAALPTLQEGSWMRADVPEQGTGQWSVDMMLRIPGEWPEESTQILAWRTSGRPWNRFEIRMTHNAFQLWAFNEDLDPPSSLLMVNVFRHEATSEWRRYTAYSREEDGEVRMWAGSAIAGGTATGSGYEYDGDPGSVTQIDTRFGAALERAGVGHLVVRPSAGRAPQQHAEVAFAGETALVRIRRLAQEEAVSISAPGDPVQSTAMGPQGVATLLELLEECADADGGILAERTTMAGLHYSPRHLIYGRTPRTALSAAESEISAPLAPVLDDQRIRTVVTVARDGGSSATEVDQEAVQRIGRYEDSLTLSLAEDEQATQLAAWLLHRGTWPGMRYPSITTDLAVAPQCAGPWMDSAPGTRLQVTGLPPQHHGPVDVMAEGLTEEISPTRWQITAACSPWGPWRVGEISPPDEAGPPEETAPTHVDTAGSHLDTAASGSDTELRVLTMDDRPWVTTAGPTITAEPGDLPVDVQVGGEVMTATAIEPLLWDTWDREVTDGWGTSGSGHPWQLAGGSESDRSVADGGGMVTLVDDPADIRAQILPLTVGDGEVAVTVSVDQVAAGAPLYPALIVRFDGVSWYRVRLALDTSGSVWIQLTQDSTVLEQVQTSYTYEPGTRLRMRMRMQGQHITGTVWHAETPMPPPQLATEVVESPIDAGQIGTAFSSAGGNNYGASATFSSLETSTPQKFAVTRSVNGIEKQHTSGADLRLADPIIIAL